MVLFCGDLLSRAGMFWSVSISLPACLHSVGSRPGRSLWQPRVGCSHDVDCTPVSSDLFCCLHSSTNGVGHTPPSVSCSFQIDLLLLLMNTSGLFGDSPAFLFIRHLAAFSVSFLTDINTVQILGLVVVCLQLLIFWESWRYLVSQYCWVCGSLAVLFLLPWEPREFQKLFCYCHLPSYVIFRFSVSYSFLYSVPVNVFANSPELFFFTVLPLSLWPPWLSGEKMMIH